MTLAGNSFRVGGIDAVNGDVVPLVVGTPVYPSSGSVLRASAGSLIAAGVVGLIIGGAGPTLPVSYVVAGTLTLATTAGWDAVTGQSGGLTPGAHYYVGTEAGKLTTSPPFLEGQAVALVGRALTTTSLLVVIQPPILL